MNPDGRGSACCAEYPAETLYAQRSLTAAAWVARAEKKPPAPACAAPAPRSNRPVPTDTDEPAMSRGDFVRMFTTPSIAFAPQTADAGPRMSSICLISSDSIGTESHKTKP